MYREKLNHTTSMESVKELSVPKSSRLSPQRKDKKMDQKSKKMYTQKPQKVAWRQSKKQLSRVRKNLRDSCTQLTQQVFFDGDNVTHVFNDVTTVCLYCERSTENSSDPDWCVKCHNIIALTESFLYKHCPDVRLSLANKHDLLESYKLAQCDLHTFDDLVTFIYNLLECNIHDHHDD